MSPDSPDYGAYGKMPCLGDFFRIGLGPGFTAPWDAWLQHGLVSARRAMGDRWRPAYLSAPIWRFTLSPGVAGAQAAQGVLMASVDRVGREFPLTLARVFAEPPALQEAHLEAEQSFALLENVALDALEDTMTRALLEQRLATVPRSTVPLRRDMRESGKSVWTTASPGNVQLFFWRGLPPLHILFDPFLQPLDTAEFGRD